MPSATRQAVPCYSLSELVREIRGTRTMRHAQEACSSRRSRGGDSIEESTSCVSSLSSPDKIMHFALIRGGEPLRRTYTKLHRSGRAPLKEQEAHFHPTCGPRDRRQHSTPRPVKLQLSMQAQCPLVPENTFITITPQIIRAMPASAPVSSFCP
jgi:hypothetical protein